MVPRQSDGLEEVHSAASAVEVRRGDRLKICQSKVRGLKIQEIVLRQRFVGANKNRKGLTFRALRRWRRWRIETRVRISSPLLPIA